MQPRPKKSPNGVKSKKKEIVSEGHKKGSQNAVFVHNKYDRLHDEGEGEMEQDTVAEINLEVMIFIVKLPLP